MRSLATLLLCLLLAGCGSQPRGASNTSDGLDDPSLVSLPPTDFAYCDVIKRRIPVRDCDDLRAMKSEIHRGAAALTAPDPIRRGKSFEVALVVDRRPTGVVAELDDAGNASEDVAENAAEDVGNAAAGPEDALGNAAGNASTAMKKAADPPSADPGSPTPSQIVAERGDTPVAFAPKVGQFMSADLKGRGFEIKPLSERSQEIPEGGQATWLWEVVARDEGRLTLTARTIVEGEVGGERYPLGDTQSTKTVTVEVGAIDRISDLLDGLPGWLQKLAAVLTALTALLAAWFGLRAALRKGKAPAGS